MQLFCYLNKISWIFIQYIYVICICSSILITFRSLHRFFMIRWFITTPKLLNAISAITIFQAIWKSFCAQQLLMMTALISCHMWLHIAYRIDRRQRVQTNDERRFAAHRKLLLLKATVRYIMMYRLGIYPIKSCCMAVLANARSECVVLVGFHHTIIGHVYLWYVLERYWSISERMRRRQQQSDYKCVFVEL